MKKKILVIDDENSIREVVKDILEHEGYNVILGVNSEEAIRKAQEVELTAKEAADTAAKVAEEAISIAEGAISQKLIRKIISSWDFLAILLVVLLASIMAAVSLSLGLSLFGR